MSCSNCYNGCSQITSDQCVRYTGIDVPVLGIKTGDSLSYVEQALIEFLVSTLDGSGIKVDIPQSILCQLVSKYLPTCGDLTVVDVLKALIQAACDLQAQVGVINTQITSIQTSITAINAPYTLPSGCLSGVPTNPTTHDVVQAVVTTLCAFMTDVETNYVLIADINTYIQQYLSSQSTSTKMYTKMVPFVAYEYYNTDLSNFNGSGQGQGNWEKIYLCNGQNGTPDKRGRVAVGATTGMGGGPMSPYVAPGGFNPDYTLNSTFGSNSVILSVNQIPSHTHIPTIEAEITPNPHHHTAEWTTGIAGASGDNGTLVSGTQTTSDVDLQVNIKSAYNSSAGGDDAHANNQPAIGCYYIMYIP